MVIKCASLPPQENQKENEGIGDFRALIIDSGSGGGSHASCSKLDFIRLVKLPKRSFSP